MLGYGKVSAEGYSQTLKSLEKDIDSLRSDLKGLAKSIKQGTREKYGDVAGWFKEATSDVKPGHKFSGAMSSVKDTGQKAAHKTRSGIEHRPFVSVLTALAVGIGIAMLMRRSHH